MKARSTDHQFSIFPLSRNGTPATSRNIQPTRLRISVARPTKRIDYERSRFRRPQHIQVLEEANIDEGGGKAGLTDEGKEVCLAEFCSLWSWMCRRYKVMGVNDDKVCLQAQFGPWNARSDDLIPLTVYCDMCTPHRSLAFKSYTEGDCITGLTILLPYTFAMGWI